MRVGITGAHGFIGSAVTRALRARGDEARPFDSPLDICNLTQVTRFVKGCDAVINLAGILGTSETVGHDKELVDVNIVGALNVADACNLLDVPLVQIGTGHKGTPNVYAVTKACAEDLLLCRAKWLGDRVNIVRAFHAYGPGQKAPAPWGNATVTKIIPNFVCRALAGEPLPLHGGGDQRADLVHVDDVARALVSGLSEPYGRVLEAGTGVGTSVRCAAADVIAFVGSSSICVDVPLPPGFTGSDAVAASPEPYSVAWPDGLKDTVEYYRRLV